MDNETPGEGKRTARPDGTEDNNAQTPDEKISKRPLFDEPAKEEPGIESTTGGGEEPQKPKADVTTKEPPTPGKDQPELEEDLEAIEEPTSRRNLLKWVVIGGGGFVLALMIAFFFASLYLHKKKATLASVKSPRVYIQPVLKKKKKVVIKQYVFQPFFLRLKNNRTGEDKFLSAQIYVEFVRDKLPNEIHAKREILRTLIYKQLLKHFADGKDTPKKEKKFEDELIAALNTFFHGGGVYDIGFKELEIR